MERSVSTFLTGFFVGQEKWWKCVFLRLGVSTVKTNQDWKSRLALVSRPTFETFQIVHRVAIKNLYFLVEFFKIKTFQLRLCMSRFSLRLSRCIEIVKIFQDALRFVETHQDLSRRIKICRDTLFENVKIFSTVETNSLKMSRQIETPNLSLFFKKINEKTSFFYLLQKYVLCSYFL
jgi:hypothetical protein